MKSYFIVLMLVGLCCAEHVHDDGQPGCKTDNELKVKLHRNNWDPTRYWICEQKGVPASEVKCPDGTAWLDSKKSCVEWHDWVWEIPVAPESRP